MPKTQAEARVKRHRPRISRKPDEVKARILKAAEAEFTAFGYDGANTTRIARAFGGATNTIFRHFESKRGLFLAVVELLIVRWKDKLDLDSISSEGPQEWLEAYAVAILRWIVSDEMIFVANVADVVRRDIPEITRIFHRQGHIKFSTILEERLKTWTKAGLLDCKEAEEDATDFINLATMKWINRRKLLGASMPTEEQIRSSAHRTVDIFLNGCALAKAGRRASTSRSHANSRRRR